LAADLRGEGWALVNRHGIYTPEAMAKDQKGKSYFVVFDLNVSAIQRRKAQLAALETPGAHARHEPKRRG
jgi:hypothetical protein